MQYKHLKCIENKITYILDHFQYYQSTYVKKIDLKKLICSEKICKLIIEVKIQVQKITISTRCRKISWFLLHLRNFFYVIHNNFDWKSWLVYFFTRFTHEKNPQKQIFSLVVKKIVMYFYMEGGKGEFWSSYFTSIDRLSRKYFLNLLVKFGVRLN